MASYIREVADALATGLGLSALTTGATVQRVNWLEIDADALSSPAIFVLPGEVEISRVSRTVSQIDVTATIYVGQRVLLDSEVDSIMDLADTVLLLLRSHDWPEGIGWPESASSPMELSTQLNPDDGLTERNVWRAIITPTYRFFATDALT
jgi:hypothetical protein